MIGIDQAQTIARRPDEEGAAGERGTAPAPSRGRGWVAIAAAPTALAALLLLVASASNGAYAIHSWGPLAVFGLIALAVARPAPASRPALAMAAFAWAYALWSLISVLWAQMPGEAVEGGARNVLYAVLLSLPVITLPDRRAAVWLGQIVTAGLGVLVLGTLIALQGDGASHFLAGRLADPVGYRNGAAALFALTYWPLVTVASRRSTRALLRAACFSLAVAALGLAFLTQSRGVVIGFVGGGIVALALGPDRLRRVWLTVLVLGVLAARSGVLLDPYDAYVKTLTTSAPAVDRAVDALTALAVAGFVGALILALLDGGLRVSASAARTMRIVASAVLVLLAVAALGVGLARIGDPVALARTKIDEFKRLDTGAPGETRLGSTGGQRYDLWRIAWNEFTSAPVAGVGQSSYEPGYYAQRRTDRNLTTPHSIALSVLAETGLVGAMLFAGMLIAAALALARGWGGATRDQRRWASGLAAAGAVLLTQTLVDWLWLIPGITGLALLCLGLAVAIVARPPDAAEPSRARAWLPLRIVPVLAAVLIAALVVSDLYVRTARADTSATPTHRLSLARTAAHLDPFADAPRYLEASALEEQGRRGAARGVLLDVLHREPRSFVAMALLGDLETRAGHRAAARRWYRRALALNPRDTGLQQLAKR